MNKYKLIIEYDGTKYKGWQRLKNSDKTIQEKIELLLSKILEQHIEIHGAGRTDSGVHAYNQVAHFETKNKLDIEKLLNISNEMLPQDIVFKAIEEVDADFHARYSAKAKRYVYKIWNDQIPSALERKYSYHIPHKLDIDAMREAASYLIGEHDFSSFTADKSKKKSKSRTIYDIQIRIAGVKLELEFYGEGFLHKMVRIITGTLVDVGLGIKNPQDITEIIRKKDRQMAGDTVPSHGLYLLEVEY